MDHPPHPAPPLRLLVIPGLHDSPPAHWQSWLQAASPGAVRVQQQDWQQADLPRWSAAIDHTLAQAGPGRWLAVAHSFGVLALADHLARRQASPVVAALLVAPADPAKFGLDAQLPQHELPRPATLVASSTDPWMSLNGAARWAARWGCPLINLGAAGHVNVASGHRQLPLAEEWLRINAGRHARPAQPPLALAA